MFRFLCLALFCCASPVFAQDLTVELNEATTSIVTQTIQVSTVVDSDGEPIGKPTPNLIDETEPVETISVLIDIETEANNVTVSASDSDRNPVELKKITDRRYAVPATSDRTWVKVRAIDFAANIFAEQEIVVPGQELPNPDPDAPKTLSQSIRTATKAVRSPTKSDDAATLAGIFRSVAGRAAGLHTMTPESMIRETDNQIASKLSSAARRSWKHWGAAFKSALESEGLSVLDKPGHIAAWQTIAKALQGIKSSNRSNSGPILSPPPVIGPAVEWVSPLPTF